MNLHCCGWFSVLSEALNMFFTPAMLLVCGVTLSAGIGIHRILRPSRFLHTLLDIPENSRTTPFKAVTMALAGTLGVGNITGVSAAILQGGIGAVFWMWVG
ncbi:MAG: alanine:cation symporter family protein, partial [Clostridia bacterium]|nr:alanine:cation symporter family protein [Clostridia bacterium]